MNKSQKTNDDTPWWVVQTKPQSEFTVMQHLQNQGLTPYCPLFKKERIRGRQLKVKNYPLFPRYVFVEANPAAHQKIHNIRSTFGVSKLLKIGEVPIKISCKLIHELRQMEVEEFDKTQSDFKPGDHVKIKEGLYQHLEAVYQMDDGLERAVVLLSIINKKTPLRIFKHAIKKV